MFYILYKRGNLFIYLLFLLFAIISAEKQACELHSCTSTYLIKFYKEDCIHCKNIVPHLNEVLDKLRNNDVAIKFKEISCDNCNCDALDVVAVPTIILSKGKEELSRIRGFSDFDGIVKFILDNYDVSARIFDRVMPSDGSVITLYERDFYSGFGGPWIILFDKNRKDKMREILKEISFKFTGHLSVGEISENNVVNLTHRFNIQAFPAVIAIYNGILAGCNEKHTNEEVLKFVEKLVAPSFK